MWTGQGRCDFKLKHLRVFSVLSIIVMILIVVELLSHDDDDEQDDDRGTYRPTQTRTLP